MEQYQTLIDFIIVVGIFFIILGAWAMLAIISMNRTLSKLLDLFSTYFSKQKSGSRETPDGAEPLH